MKRLLELVQVVNVLSEAAARRLAWLPPLLARLIVGIVFVQSGWGKLHAIDGVIELFRALEIPWPEVQAPFAAANELVFGALVLVGVVTRLAAVPLVIVMLVAIKTAVWPNLETSAALLNTSELLYISLLVWLASNGAGDVSVDAFVTRLQASQGRGVDHPSLSPSAA